MNNNDTIDLGQTPFYCWDSIPYDLEVEAPSLGVAADTTYGIYLSNATPRQIDSVERPSMFEGHELVRASEGVASRVDTSAPAWVFGVLLALVALTAYYFYQRKLRFKELLVSLMDSRAMDRMLRNNNLTRSSQLAPMGLLLTVTAALPVHQLALAKTGMLGYLALAAALTVAYYLRNGIMRLLATVFDNNDAVGVYITSNYLYHLTLATAMLPLLFPLLYMPFGHEVLLYLLLGLVAVVLVVRLIRGLQLFLTQSNSSYFYLFYYLCIVEIAPILLLLKWLIG